MVPVGVDFNCAGVDSGTREALVDVHHMSVREIARVTGLSKTAVSLALHDSPKISDAAKERVRKAARKLGYRLNAKVTELMSHVRSSRHSRIEACFGVISLYGCTRPWEGSQHLLRIYEGMVARAQALGYRLEPIGVRAPGMTHQRARNIFDARGIEGLLCFGGPDIDEEFPAAFDHYAIVTVGLSIKTQLHRVITHSYNNIWGALEKLHALGYRRPGLVIGSYEEARSKQTYVSAYFGWCEHVLGTPSPIPVLRQERVETTPLHAWLKQHRPDAIVIVHLYDALDEFATAVRRLGFRVPEDLGIAAVSQILDGTGLAGMQENQSLMGGWAVELLVARIMNRDFGIPTHPRIEMVECEWVEGRSLRRQ